MVDLPEAGRWLIEAPIYGWSDLESDPSLPPRVPGIYAWFFVDPPSVVPIANCIVRDRAYLLYVGISPGRTPSTQNLRNRMRYHFRGNAEGSTLRLTLGCLLESDLGTVLMRVGSGRRKTFAQRETVLTQWMTEHARVAWKPTNEPKELESRLIRSLCLPLNLDENTANTFHPTLVKIRYAARARALASPVFT
jgi:hypothetical protein